MSVVCPDIRVTLQLEPTMTEREIVEAMAKALWKFSNPRRLWAHLSKMESGYYRDMARAALEALKTAGCKMMEREPTQAEIVAGCKTPKMKLVEGAMIMAQVHGAKYQDWLWNNSPLAEARRAMFDAAPWWPGEGK